MTQSEGILAALKKGGSLTPLSALRSLGCLRLAARVADLRRLGYPIRTRIVERGGARVAEYSMGRTR